MTRYHTTAEGNIPFTAEEEAEWDAMEAAHEEAINAQIVPKSVGMAYGIEAMINAGVHEQVETYIQTLPAVDQIYFQRSTNINRNHNVVEKVRVGMGWTHDYVDDLFIQADQIFKQRTGLA